MECKFSLSVMSDDYVHIILDALRQVDTQHIESHTDALSTTYRGPLTHVLEAVQACFVYANNGHTHITLQAALTSQPGSQAAPAPRPGLAHAAPPRHFSVLASVSFYPMGVAEYTHHVAQASKWAADSHILTQALGCTLELAGDVGAIFQFIGKVMAYAEEQPGLFFLHATLSINSPSTAKGA